MASPSLTLSSRILLHTSPHHPKDGHLLGSSHSGGAARAPPAAVPRLGASASLADEISADTDTGRLFLRRDTPTPTNPDAPSAPDTDTVATSHYTSALPPLPSVPSPPLDVSGSTEDSPSVPSGGYHGNLDPQSTSFLSSGSSSSLLNSSAFSRQNFSPPPDGVTRPFHNLSLSPSTLKKSSHSPHSGASRAHERKHDRLSVSFDENTTRFQSSHGAGATGLAGAFDPRSESFLSMNSSGFSRMSHSAPLFDGGPSGALPSRTNADFHTRGGGQGNAPLPYYNRRPAPRTDGLSEPLASASHPGSGGTRPGSGHSSRSHASRHALSSSTRRSDSSHQKSPRSPRSRATAASSHPSSTSHESTARKELMQHFRTPPKINRPPARPVPSTVPTKPDHVPDDDQDVRREANRNFEKLELKYKKLKRSFSNMETELQVSQLAKEQTKNEQEATKAELDHARRKVKTLESDLQEARRIRDKYQRDLNSSKTSAFQKDVEIGTHLETIENLRSDVESATMTMQQQRTKLEAELTQHQGDIANLTSELNHKDQQHDLNESELRREIQRLKNELALRNVSTEEHEVSALREQLADAKRRASILESDARSLESQQRQREHEVEQQNLRLTNERKQTQALQTECDRLRKQIEDTNTQLSSARKQAHDALQKVADSAHMYASAPSPSMSSFPPSPSDSRTRPLSRSHPDLKGSSSPPPQLPSLFSDSMRSDPKGDILSSLTCPEAAEFFRREIVAPLQDALEQRGAAQQSELLPSKSDERLGGVLSDVQHKLNEFALKSDSNMRSLIDYQQKLMSRLDFVRQLFSYVKTSLGEPKEDAEPLCDLMRRIELALNKSQIVQNPDSPIDDDDLPGAVSDVQSPPSWTSRPEAANKGQTNDSRVIDAYPADDLKQEFNDLRQRLASLPSSEEIERLVASYSEEVRSTVQSSSADAKHETVPWIKEMYQSVHGIELTHESMLKEFQSLDVHRQYAVLGEEVIMLRKDLAELKDAAASGGGIAPAALSSKLDEQTDVLRSNSVEQHREIVRNLDETKSAINDSLSSTSQALHAKIDSLSSKFDDFSTVTHAEMSQWTDEQRTHFERVRDRITQEIGAGLQRELGDDSRFQRNLTQFLTSELGVDSEFRRHLDERLPEPDDLKEAMVQLGEGVPRVVGKLDELVDIQRNGPAVSSSWGALESCAIGSFTSFFFCVWVAYICAEIEIAMVSQ